MQAIRPGRALPLHGIEATRRIENELAASLPPFSLMARAGEAIARWCLALQPHAQRFWVACGPGNNGGDGLVAATWLKAWGKTVHVSLAALPGQRMPHDAERAMRGALAAGITISGGAPEQWDCAVDAMLGLGARPDLSAPMRDWALLMNRGDHPVLGVDLPSGLDADTGTPGAVVATHTLALLTLKPGMWTATGRDRCGEIWWDGLGVPSDALTRSPDAWLNAAPERRVRPHSSHKGTSGDVAIVGGALGMEGAAVLAALAAIHSGAGRTYLASVGAAAGRGSEAPIFPEIMRRAFQELHLAGCALACGCGGGTEVASVLEPALRDARALVLDADALNILATESALQRRLIDRAAAGKPTVITPHPLEAARLLGSQTSQVQANRLAAAHELCGRFCCVVVLKGSGTIIASPGAPPRINPSGNGRLAVGGTGDVLAGMIAAELARGLPAAAAATAAVYAHGAQADAWPRGRPLTALALAMSLTEDLSLS